MICSIVTLSSCSQSNTMFVYPFHYVFSGRLSLGSFIAILLIYLFIHIYFFFILIEITPTIFICFSWPKQVFFPAVKTMKEKNER